MVKATVIGLETDGPVKQYLSSRHILSMPFPIQGFEIIDKVGRDMINCIRREDLYALVDATGLGTQAFTQMPVFVYGSSRYHHVSHGLLKRVIDPWVDKYLVGEGETGYTVLLKDNHEDLDWRHTDPAYPDEEFIHCGTHMHDSIFDEKTACRSSHYIKFSHSRRLEIKSVSKMMKGTPANIADIYYQNILMRRAHNEDDYRKLADLYDESHLTDMPELAELMVHFMLPNVYITIDIDALSRDVVDIAAHEFYDQGNMTLEDMLFALGLTLQKKHVIGVEINGMTPDPRCQGVYDAILDKIHSA